MANPSETIRLGVDLGAMLFRTAYMYPDEDGDVVEVPFTLDTFRPCFPITERLPINDVYIPRFFPALSQRLTEEFSLSLGGQSQGMRQIAADLIAQTLSAAGAYSGQSVDGLLLSVPIWLGMEARKLLRDAIREAGVERGGLCDDADAAGAYLRAGVLDLQQSAFALYFSAGYTGLGMALLRLTPRGDRVLAQCGDQGVLAGNMLDFAILQGAFQRLKQARVPVSDTPQMMVWTELQRRVEMAKQEIGDRDMITFVVPQALMPGRGSPMACNIVGSELRRVVDDHLGRARSLLDDLLEEAGVEDSEIHHIILNGGTTHLPAIRPRLQEWMPEAELRHLPPHALASGAARLVMREPGVSRGTSTDAPSGLFIPKAEDFTALVSLADSTAAAAAPAPLGAGVQSGGQRGDAGAPVPGDQTDEDEVPIDRVTLTELRLQARNGQRDVARLRLQMLRTAVEEELRGLDEPDPSTGSSSRA